MSTIVTIDATERGNTGTGSARAVRREGNVPAVVYGGAKGPQHIALNARELTRHYLSGRFLTTICNLKLAGELVRVIPREVQLDPVSDRPIHADFMRLVEGARVRLAIPVHFKGQEDSPGLKRGGVLNVVRHDIEMFCPADRIPAFVEVDLKGMDIGDSLHISAVKMPEGVRPVIANRDFTIATVAAPSGYADATAATTATAEGAAAPAAGAAPAAAAGAKPGAPAAGAKGGAAAPAKGAAPAKAAPAKAAAAAPAKKK